MSLLLQKAEMTENDGDRIFIGLLLFTNKQQADGIDARSGYAGLLHKHTKTPTNRQRDTQRVRTNDNAGGLLFETK